MILDTLNTRDPDNLRPPFCHTLSGSVFLGNSCSENTMDAQSFSRQALSSLPLLTVLTAELRARCLCIRVANART